MTFSIVGRPIQKVGVIGSGQIGPDIALYFSKVLSPAGTRIVVVDVAAEALEKGKAKLEKKVDRGVQTGAFSSEQAAAMKEAVTFTQDYDAVRGANLVVEAASENQELKAKIFAQLEALCGDDAILVSNSSHLEPERLFAGLRHRGRALVVHYFFPAERNPVVEVVPGADTDPELARGVRDFYEAMGKVPIMVGSRYGYAIDPVFEGLFQAAALLVEAGVGTTKEVDAAACKALGYTVGPFTAMNLTGGNPLTNHGLEMYRQRGVMEWFRAPESLKRKVETGEAWDTPKRGETVEVAPDKEARIRDALRGAYFGLVGNVLDSGISTVADLDMAVEMALDMSPPFRLMNQIGVKESLALVEAYAKENPGFVVPRCLKERAASGRPWEIPTVFREDRDGVAVVTIRRPKVLNAMNQEAFRQLAAHFRDIARDPSVKGAVVTGFGRKAFVSGADVHFLARIETPEQGEATSAESNECVKAIEDCGKPVVCAMNGFAFGGGNEIAMACNARIARAGLGVLAGQPEPNLGIIPGAGATQRLPRWVGIEKAAELLRTGRPITAEEALRIGLIQKIVDGDLVAEAIRMVSEDDLPRIDRGPLPVPKELPPVDIGHLSRAVDAILCRAILEGNALPLEQGLALESKLFGQVCQLHDMKVGVRTFLEKGPGQKPAFTHS